ncbi:MAG TPA: diacylglycerol kinase family protein [Polyangiaceae bacterium]
MSGIGVVLNPKSGKNLRDPGAARRLARALGDRGIIREAHSIDELYRIAEDFQRLEIDVLGISGGDGTNHVTLTGFIDVYKSQSLPQVAFLRGGTMNTVANHIGIPRGQPEGLLDRLVRAYAERATRPLVNVERHVMHIGNTYGFLFGTGAVYGFLAEYYRGGTGQPSPIIAARTLLGGIGSALVGGEIVSRIAAPFQGSVELDDGTTWEERDYFAVAGGTIDQIGLNFKPFYRWAERPGTFHLLGIHTSAMGFVADLPRIWRAAPMREGKTYEATPTRARLHSRDGTMRYMIDGDLHESKGPLDVTIGPRVKILSI